MDQSPSRRSRRVAAWALLAVVLAGGVAAQALAAPQPAGPPAAAAPAAGSPDPGQAPGTQQAGPGVLLAADPQAPAATSSAWPGASSIDTLPAWRWQNIALDNDSSGVIDAVRSVPSAFGGLMLMAANFCWQVLLWVLRFALAGSGELLTYAAGPINAAVGTLSSAIWLALALPVFAWLLWKVFTAWLGRSGPAKASRNAIRGLVVLALIVVIGQASAAAAQSWKPDDADAIPQAIAACDAQASSEQDLGIAADNRQQCVQEALSTGSDSYARMKAQREAPGTLPWFAYTVSGAAGMLSSAFNVAAIIPLPGVKETATGSMSPNCAAYISQLHRGFTDANGDSSKGSLSTLSRLWENTQYRSWMGSAFGQASGGYDLPGNSMCRFAETANSRPAAEQQTIESLAEANFNAAAPIAAPSGSTAPVFGPFADYSLRDARLATTAWVACEWDGSAWTVSKAFAGAKEATDISKDCAQAFTGDSLPSMSGVGRGVGAVGELVDGVRSGQVNPLQGMDVLGNVLAATDVPLASVYSQPGSLLVSDDAAGQAGNQAALNWVSAYRGSNSGERMLNGLLALVTAVVFMLTLGQIGLGLFLAQFMLILLLMIMPVILIMWALGMDSKARGLTRLTLTLLFAQVFFTVLISAIVTISALFQGLSTAIAGPLLSNGLVRALLYGLAPVIAFYLVRKLISMLGLANVMSFSGAVGFVAGSAMMATGDRSTQQAARTSRWQGNKSPLQQTLEKGKLSKLERFSGSTLTAPGNPRNVTKSGRARSKADMGKAWGSDPAKQGRKRTRKEGTAYADAVDRLSSAGRLRKTKGKRLKGLSETAVAAGDVFHAGASSAAASTRQFGGKLRRKGKRADAGFDPRRDEGIPMTELPIGEGPMVRTPSYVSPAEAHHAAVVAKQRRNGKVRSGQVGHADAHRAHVDSAMRSASSMWLDHAEDDFHGFASPIELGSYRSALAHHSGLGSSDIVVGYSGMGAVKWRDRSEMRSLTPQALRDPGLWLSAEYGAQRGGETSDDYLARRYATLLEAGMMSPGGELVDALELIGLGPDSPQRDARVQAWLDGRNDQLLDSTTLNLKNANSAAVIRASQMASEWAGGRMEEVARERQRAVQDLAEAVHAARGAAPDISALVAQAREAFVEQLGEHEQRVRAWQQQSSEEARQAVLESFRVLEQSIDDVRSNVAEGELTRQTIVLGSAGIGADVEQLLEKAGQAMDERLRQFQEVEAQAASALFDQENTSITGLLASVDTLTREFTRDLQRSAEEAEASLQRALRRLEVSDAETQVRREGAERRYAYARTLVEQAGVPAFP